MQPSVDRRRSGCNITCAALWLRTPLPGGLANQCYFFSVRLHITLDEEMVAELDRRAGRRGRSSYIAELLRRAFEDERRWEDIESALGIIPDAGHEWDDDPAAWMRAQRSSGPTRSG